MTKYPSVMTAPAEEGFYSYTLTHLDNMSFMLKRIQHIDHEITIIINDESSNRCKNQY
jgi:hypothetical protein